MYVFRSRKLERLCGIIDGTDGKRHAHLHDAPHPRSAVNIIRTDHGSERVTLDDIQEVRVVSQDHTQAKRDENSIQVLLCTHSGTDLEDRFVVAALKVAKTNAFGVCAAVLSNDRAPLPFPNYEEIGSGNLQLTEESTSFLPVVEFLTLLYRGLGRSFEGHPSMSNSADALRYRKAPSKDSVFSGILTLKKKSRYQVFKSMSQIITGRRFFADCDILGFLECLLMYMVCFRKVSQSVLFCCYDCFVKFM